MQLGRKKKTPAGKTLVTSLAAATCALLGTSPTPSIAQGKPRQWQFDTALFYYNESDRVTDASARFLARRKFRFGRLLSLNLAVDTLTGASASGATPAGAPQTFTQPSGKGSYTIAPGETPLDPSFLDTRVALSGNWEQDLGEKSRMNLGLSLSNEYDYFHAGVNARWMRDFNGRNTTLNLGAAFASDSIDPEGGAPIPLAPMLPPGDLSNKLGDDSKTVTDVIIGVTQVFGRRTVAEFAYSLSASSGYLADPYKLISVVDPVTGDPTPGPGGLNLFRFENRPDSRTKNSIFAHLKHRLHQDIIDVSYRFMTDDWGIDSHTVDFRYRWKMGERSYIQPHLRYYTQSAADFYVAFLVDGDPLPKDAAADYRLGDFDGVTIGAKYGRSIGEFSEWSVRIEYYNQSGTSPPGIGSLRNFDLYPSVDAVIVQAGYRF